MRALCRLWLIAILLLAALSSARAGDERGPVSFLPPLGCLPADGGPAYDLHLFGPTRRPGDPGLVVDTSAGRIVATEDLGAGLVRVRFAPPKLSAPGTIRFVTRNPSTETSLPACPYPAGQIRVQVEPDRLLAGQGQKAALRIEVEDADGQVLGRHAPQITVNVGRIDALEREGPGRFRAVYTPPNDPFPQVAIIMVAHRAGARMERVAVARAIVPITARVDLPGKTAPGTSMQMVVAGRRFGPVRSDKKGRFSLPILVPPGFGQGQATSIDRAGNRRTRTIDLFLPETNQLGLWAFPMRLPADGQSRARLLVTTIDRFGQPADVRAEQTGGPVRIRAGRGRVSTVRRLAVGLFEAYYTAPDRVGPGHDDLEVTFPEGGSRSRASLRIALAPGPVARVELSVPELQAADGASGGAVALRVSDAAGNPVAREVVRLTADPGRLSEVREVEPGHHRATLVVDQNPSAWVSQVTAAVTDRRGEQPARLLVGPDGLADQPEGAGQAVPALNAALVDDMNLPVSGQRVAFELDGRTRETSSDGFGRVRFDLPAEGPPGPHSAVLRLTADPDVFKQVYLVRQKGAWRLLPVDLDRSLPPAGLLRQAAQVRLHPPVGVLLTIEDADAGARTADHRIVIRAADASGQALPGRRIVLRASAGRCSEVRDLGDGRYEARWSSPDPPLEAVVLSAVEAASGAGTVLRIAGAGGVP